MVIPGVVIPGMAVYGVVISGAIFSGKVALIATTGIVATGMVSGADCIIAAGAVVLGSVGIRNKLLFLFIHLLFAFYSLLPPFALCFNPFTLYFSLFTISQFYSSTLLFHKGDREKYTLYMWEKKRGMDLSYV